MTGSSPISGWTIPADSDPLGDLGQIIRDMVDDIEAGWTDYVPVWSTTGTPASKGNGTLTGRYKRIGKTVHFRINLVAGSTTNQGSGAQTFSLPFTAHATGEQAVHLKLYTGAVNYAGNGVIGGGATTVQAYVPTSTANPSLVILQSTSPNTGTTGNLVIEGSYEAA